MIEIIDEIRKYQPTPEEKARGLSSSTKSKGPVGLVNKAIAGVIRQDEVDIIGFIQDWHHREY